MIRELDISRPSVYEVYYEAYEHLALAEVLHLTNNLDKAYDKFLEELKVSDSFGHELEKAHALLGIAETKRLMGEIDQESCRKALEIYRKVGSKWGEVHTLIALALIEIKNGKGSSALLKQAASIAQEASLKSDVEFIAYLDTKGQESNKRHVLIFV